MAGWRFGSDILPGCHPRVPSIVTEMMEAGHERRQALSKGSAAGHPFWYLYTGNPGTEKEWGDDYPKADHSHLPPNNEPDNQKRTSHIKICRFMVPGMMDASYHGMSRDIDHQGQSGRSMKLIERFIKADDTYYRPYDDVARTTDGVVFNVWKDALGAGYSEEKYTDQPLRDKDDENPHYPTPPHVNQIRRMIETLHTFWIGFKTSGNEVKTTGPIAGTSHADAWANAKTVFAGLAWQADPFSWYPQSTSVMGWLNDAWDHVGGVHVYTATITAVRGGFWFDFDFDINGLDYIDWSIFDPTVGIFVGHGYRSWTQGHGENSGYYDDYDVTGLMAKIEELGLSASLIRAGGKTTTENGWRGYPYGDVPEAAWDNDNYELHVITYNNYSSADLDKCKPPDPPVVSETPYAYSANERTCQLTGTGSPKPVPRWPDPLTNCAGTFYVACKPQWKWGLDT